MASKAETAAEMARCREVLRELFAAGDVRVMVTTDFSRSVRRCRLLVPQHGRDGLEIVDATYYVAKACDLRLNDRGISFGGYGYSASTELVHRLARVLDCDPYSVKFDELRVG